MGEGGGAEQQKKEQKNTQTARGENLLNQKKKKGSICTKRGKKVTRKKGREIEERERNLGRRGEKKRGELSPQCASVQEETGRWNQVKKKKREDMNT